MERKVPDEEEKKNPTKRNPLRVAITLFLSIHTHYKDGLLILSVMQTPGIMNSSFLEILSSCEDSSVSSAGVVEYSLKHGIQINTDHIL